MRPAIHIGPNFCTIAESLRWKRLISPHGVCHLPKSAVSLSIAAASDSRRCSAVAFDFMYS